MRHNLPRLFVDAPVLPAHAIELNACQSHYLTVVLRLKAGDELLVFNGRDGEWLAHITTTRRQACVIETVEQIRPQPEPGRIAYWFAPLKQARQDYMVQKAVEMGASRLSPVITARTIAGRVNLDRMKANAIEAAEQCGILSVPPIDEPVKLAAALKGAPKDTCIVFCDEGAALSPPLDALRTQPTAYRVAVLVGPEGGFTSEERQLLISQPLVKVISLGPRILRADTAAVAALALVQAVLGDWT